MPGLPTATDEEIGFQPPPSNPLINLPGSVPGWASKGKMWKALPPMTYEPIGSQDDIIHFNPVIIIFMSLIKSEDLTRAVRSAKEKIPEFMEAMEISDAQSFFVFANKMLKWTPTENVEAKDIYDILCLFYFILDQEPLLGLQTPVHPSSAGKPLSPLSSWIVVFAQLIGLFMDTPASINEKTFQTFVDSPKYALHEAVIPRGGFRTFNDFFSRHLKDGMRPIADKDDSRVITYPADCTYDNSLPNQSIVNIQDTGIIEIKGLPWTIGTLLQGSKFADHFKGGVWMHAFLNTFNYHRQHAPVSGRVIEAKNIQGAAYLEVDQQCRPIRKLYLTAKDIEKDPKCKPEAPDSPGYQFLQTRGLVVIENDVLGKVAVLPIGMAMVSSVKLSVHVGQELKKGDEISTFLFGGSDIICVFESRAGLKPENFVPSPKDDYSRYGTVLARAPGQGSNGRSNGHH
ncbi:phosphatidylserine decarboxylase [Colletotrichum tofieldiae]|uniref:Phosphatidylserine decarboxylase n=1 Tax=Colletotrichum tofieldiae TaxID=708197 RepID=A0A166SG38_9PEZI|nr:phosphatidylserine decarboxylase [Colletotrichum tofieldiae]GKT53841.1 phosphatidylserine decarboxylase [Colletotrichum tofieldiae]GKT73581.1 phosphatidylserine decarboxylase [Colletotrichum tofieldiae]GKT95527.1 phosphatidylserine decarboxylase [Colletotrichum tofieldiae]